MSRVLTLTTDFGYRDPYVAAMKGVMLTINPEVRLVDVSHDVAPQDIMEAAYVLKHVFPHFPEGTVHLVVVDPGVGTERLPVALSVDGQVFVGPDNGLFPLLFERTEFANLVILDNPAYWRTPSPSTTFHGRDIFAPVAVHLASGTPLSQVGSPLEALKPLRWALPIADAQGIQGWVIHIDHFGNCITNISQALFTRYVNDRTIRSYAGSTILEGIHRTYADVEAYEPVALFGSSGTLEIAVNGGNAAELLGINKGDQVSLVFRDAR